MKVIKNENKTNAVKNENKNDLDISELGCQYLNARRGTLFLAGTPCWLKEALQYNIIFTQYMMWSHYNRSINNKQEVITVSSSISISISCIICFNCVQIHSEFTTKFTVSFHYFHIHVFFFWTSQVNVIADVSDACTLLKGKCMMCKKYTNN